MLRERNTQGKQHAQNPRPFAIFAIIGVLWIIVAGAALRELELFGAGLFGGLILVEILLSTRDT